MDTARSLGRIEPDGFVVRTPRKTDAIGGALRGAFGTRMSLPPDMRRMLDRIDALKSV